MYLQKKSLKTPIQQIWQLGSIILLTWQIEGTDSHICQARPRLASRPSREIHRPARGRATTPSSRRQIFFFAKLLEITSFHFCHIYLRLGKLLRQTNYAERWVML